MSGKSPGQTGPRQSGTDSGPVSRATGPRSPLPIGGTGGGTTDRTTPKQWLADRISASRRTAKNTTCPHCRQPVLVGHDDDVAALTVTVDPTPIDAATELRALTNGLATYNLIGRDLCYRTHQWHVRHNPAGTGYPVHLEHRCEIR